MLLKNVKLTTKLAICKLRKEEPKVQNNLSMTPAQMLDAAESGKAIKAGILPDDYFIDGEAYANYDLPIDRIRGIDVVDCWNASKDAQGKVNKVQNSLKQIQHE